MFLDEIIMEQAKNWMLMTYYCPTHGDIGRTKLVEIEKEKIRKVVLQKKAPTKKYTSHNGY